MSELSMPLTSGNSHDEKDIEDHMHVPSTYTSANANDRQEQGAGITRKHKANKNRLSSTKPWPKENPSKKRSAAKLGNNCVGYDSTGDDSGVSSGSGTEGGYAASSSSNGNEAKAGSFSSPSSEESSEDSGEEQQNHKTKSTLSGDPMRPMLSKK
jgi:type II secretory pathway pseudopilin PulG